METIWLLESEIISHNMPIFSNKIIFFFYFLMVATLSNPTDTTKRLISLLKSFSCL